MPKKKKPTKSDLFAEPAPKKKRGRPKQILTKEEELLRNKKKKEKSAARQKKRRALAKQKKKDKVLKTEPKTEPKTEEAVPVSDAAAEDVPHVEGVIVNDTVIGFGTIMSTITTDLVESPHMMCAAPIAIPVILPNKLRTPLEDKLKLNQDSVTGERRDFFRLISLGVLDFSTEANEHMAELMAVPKTQLPRKAIAGMSKITVYMKTWKDINSIVTERLITNPQVAQSGGADNRGLTTLKYPGDASDWTRDPLRRFNCCLIHGMTDVKFMNGLPKPQEGPKPPPPPREDIMQHFVEMGMDPEMAARVKSLKYRDEVAFPGESRPYPKHEVDWDRTTRRPHGVIRKVTSGTMKKMPKRLVNELYGGDPNWTSEEKRVPDSHDQWLAELEKGLPSGDVLTEDSTPWSREMRGLHLSKKELIHMHEARGLGPRVKGGTGNKAELLDAINEFDSRFSTSFNSGVDPEDLEGALSNAISFHRDESVPGGWIIRTTTYLGGKMKSKGASDKPISWSDGTALINDPSIPSQLWAYYNTELYLFVGNTYLGTVSALEKGGRGKKSGALAKVFAESDKFTDLKIPAPYNTAGYYSSYWMAWRDYKEKVWDTIGHTVAELEGAGLQVGGVVGEADDIKIQGVTVERGIKKIYPPFVIGTTGYVSFDKIFRSLAKGAWYQSIRHKTILLNYALGRSYRLAETRGGDLVLLKQKVAPPRELEKYTVLKRRAAYIDREEYDIFNRRDNKGLWDELVRWLSNTLKIIDVTVHETDSGRTKKETLSWSSNGRTLMKRRYWLLEYGATENLKGLLHDSHQLPDGNWYIEWVMDFRTGFIYHKEGWEVDADGNPAVGPIYKNIFEWFITWDTGTLSEVDGHKLWRTELGLTPMSSFTLQEAEPASNSYAGTYNTRTVRKEWVVAIDADGNIG